MLPLIKEPGRIPKHPFRDFVDAILYLDRSGCSWRQLPVDFPPWQTVYGWFQRWKQRGVTERILDELRDAVQIARDIDPTGIAAISRSRQAAFYIDTARALSNINKDTEALRMLLNAERLAPQRVRLSPLVTETVRHLLEKSRRGTGWTQLRALCERVGVNP